MSQIANIKTAIKTRLDALKTANTLGTVIVDDFKTNPAGGLYKNIATYPAAVLGLPSITAEYETNRDNMRTHSFEIMVIQKGENVSQSSTTSIEDLMEAVLNAFDNDYTLGGTCDGATLAAGSPEQVVTEDGSFIIFSVVINARATYSLS